MIYVTLSLRFGKIQFRRDFKFRRIEFLTLIVRNLFVEFNSKRSALASLYTKEEIEKIEKSSRGLLNGNIQMIFKLCY